MLLKSECMLIKLKAYFFKLPGMILKLLVQLKWRDTIICVNSGSIKTLVWCTGVFVLWQVLQLWCFSSDELNWSECTGAESWTVVCGTCAGCQSSLQQATAQLDTPRTWTSTTQHIRPDPRPAPLHHSTRLELYLLALRWWLTPPSPHTPPSGNPRTSERAVGNHIITIIIKIMTPYELSGLSLSHTGVRWGRLPKCFSDNWSLGGLSLNTESLRREEEIL